MPQLVRIITRMNLGGPARQIEALTPRLCELGFATTILCGPPIEREGELEAEARAGGAELVRIPELQREVGLGGELRARGALRAALARLRPDLVHTHTAKAGWHGRAAARSLGIPCVHTFHGHLLHGYFGCVRAALYRAIERRASRRCAATIAVSRRVREDLIAARIVEARQCTVIHPGLELERFSIAARAPLFPSETLRLLFVGRLVAVKRPLAFVELVHALLRAGIDVEARVLGDGPLREEMLARSAALGLGERCQLLAPTREPSEHFGRCDVVVGTSVNEGLPLALVEAQASGRLVVATDVGGVREAVEHERTGFLVPAEDPRALLEALRRVARDRESAREIAAAGRTSALLRFAAARSAQEHAALYREILAQGRSS
ncbi:MAG: glycosyltransferase [Planctomycetes bacterium]|nr:glycosyltransferase [Planctomycetota bacterium]